MVCTAVWQRRRKTLTKNLLPHSKGAISQLLLISATILAKAFKATMCGTVFFKFKNRECQGDRGKIAEDV